MSLQSGCSGEASALAEKASSMFERIYGHPAMATGRAPGRINLIGEHTDYTGGCVLPMATPQKTTVELGLRGDEEVHAHTHIPRREGDEASFRLGAEARRGGWIDYIQGVTTALRNEGVAIAGFDADIESSVPAGSGLSSSAALSVALLRGLRGLFGLALSDIDIAKLGQKVETDFVGAPVGVMDPMAASLGDPHGALFIDTRTLAHERIPFPEDRAGLLVIDSGISHANAGPEYRARRAECQRIEEILHVEFLGDLRPSEIPRVPVLPEPLGRRLRHVVTENERVRAAVSALRAGDVERLGELLSASHASMRDDYEVSLPDIDRLVSIAEATPGVLGARLTGGGFGGCVIALASRTETSDLAETAANIARDYSSITGRAGQALIPAEGPAVAP
ncbi:MAG: galactokinase [Polyangiaceae bacterium]